MTSWVKDSSLKGLYKRTQGDSVVWAVKARQKGANKVVSVTLGRIELMSTATARAKAKVALAKLSEGINPNEERAEVIKRKRKAKESIKARSLSLEEALSQYLTLKQLKPKTEKDLKETINRNFSDWLSNPLLELTREMVMERFNTIKARVKRNRDEVAQRLISQGKNPTTYKSSDGVGEAQRAFRYLAAVIRSVMNDEVNGEPLLSRNPVDVLGDKKVRKSLDARETYLNESQLQDLFDLVTQQAHPQYTGKVKKDDIDFVLLLAITGMRLEEVRQIKWSDVDFSADIFKAVDTKNRRTHTLPMTDATRKIFERRRLLKPEGSVYVFPGIKDPSQPASMSRTFERVKAELGFDFSSHDLRRTFATIANEMGVDINKIGAALNHKKRNVTAGYIQTTANMLRETIETIETVIFRKWEMPD
ncbi:tyrosine-type recombinase/integrase [Burkholderiaceae bacterium]|jgi:integrase|nr:tyrosine-type recombinase/integrase [Burkholderiaceae bacterium]